MSDERYRGKQSTEIEGIDEHDPQPEEIAQLIFHHRERSVFESVATHVVTSRGLNAILDEQTKLKGLLDLFVSRKLLSEQDRQTWDVGENRIKMANKICKYQHVILDKRILPFLEPGYSVLYQIACLYEDLEADEVTPAKEVEHA